MSLDVKNNEIESVELVSESFDYETEDSAGTSQVSCVPDLTVEEVVRDPSQIADTIAQAIADTYKETEVTVAPLESMLTEAEIFEEEPAAEESIPASGDIASEQEPPESSAEPETRQEPEEADEAQAPADAPPDDPPEKSGKTKPTKKEPIKNPGTDHVKITRTHLKVSAGEYFATTFSGVLDRQKEALPPMGVNLREHEKKLALLTTLDRLLNPVRYIIFVLMLLCLAGRKYPWMTLGFMKGMNGTFVALIMTLVVMVICWQSTYRGVRDFFYLRFSHETYLLVVTILSMVEALMNKNPESLLPLLTMSWCVCGMGNLMHSQANLRGLRALITDRSKIGVRLAKKLWNGQNIIGKAPSGTGGFVRRQAEPDLWHSIHTIFVIPMLAVGVIASAYLSAKNETGYLLNLVTILSIGMPVSMALCCARPYSMLCQVLSGQGVVAGWFGIKHLSGKRTVMIYDNDLFPKGTVGHGWLKAYGKMTPEQMVSYGASLVLRADIGLEDPFVKLFQQTNAQILEVSHLSVQESGIEGRIHRNRVQVGTYHYMQLMGVSMPMRETPNALYMAVNGQLMGLFRIRYAMRSGAIAGFHRFVREKTLSCMVVTKNFSVNPAFIEKHFKAPITRLLCPKTGVRRKLSRPAVLKNSTVCGYVLREGVAAYSRTVGGARRVHRMGMWYTLSSVALSFYLMIDTIGALAAGRDVIEVTRLLLLHLILFAAVEIGARFAIKK